MILQWGNIQILACEWLPWCVPDTSCFCGICKLDLLIPRHLFDRCLVEWYGLSIRIISSDLLYLVKTLSWSFVICFNRSATSSLLILTLTIHVLRLKLLHTASVNIIWSEELRGLLQLERLALESKVCESWEWVCLRILNSVFGRGWARLAASDHSSSSGLVAVRATRSCI